MTPEVKDEYKSWEDSLLAKKIGTSGRNNLNNIWSRAKEAYPRATWKGWIDHSEIHIHNVLRNLDMLIPLYVQETIKEQEAFVLIAATLLHDIGMIPREDNSADLQYLANLRLKHGEIGAEIINENFRDFLKPFSKVLDPVCEIVKNHHGKFIPSPTAGLGYVLSADAHWVRLADELDFGPRRAPSWLLEYIQPNEEEVKHWKKHNKISEPSIDLDLFRIQVKGKVKDEVFIRKLRSEFEAPESHNLQRIFLSRGLKGEGLDRTFLIWDMTKIEKAPGEDSKDIDPRPSIFSNAQFLLGARYLYNLGRYKIARKYFEEGVNRLSGLWSDMPATPYLYHYLKTLNGLGEHKEALQIAEKYRDADFPPELKTAIAVSNGLAHWKLGEFRSAIHNIEVATDIYKVLSQHDFKYKVSEADAWVLYCIILLEEIRASKNIDPNTKIKIKRNINRGINNANKIFSQYEKENPRVPESHYKGRYGGFKAFYSLLEIDFQSIKNVEMWSETLEFAKVAYGGSKQSERNPFGAMCGKYCAAAVNYHKYENCEEELDKKKALYESAKLIKEVRKAYDDLFGHTERIFRLWHKIHRLFVLIKDALPPKLKDELFRFYGANEPVRSIEIYTPLH